MFTTQFFSSLAAYVVISFALGFIWHLQLFKGLYQRLAIYTRLDNPIIPLGFLSMLIQGALLAYLYPLFTHTGTPLLAGLKFGWLMGSFLASAAVLAEVAKQKTTSISTWLIVESVYYFIQFSLVGAAIGWIYG